MPQPAAAHLHSLNSDSRRGNLVGIQSDMRAADYATPAAFQQRLDGYLALAAQQGWLTPRTVAVFPEYTGAWLAALNERAAVYTAPTVKAAMRGLLFAHPLRLLSVLPRARGRSRLTDAVFRLKAPLMAAVYQRTFEQLAARYRITIVAGSIVLPQPALQDGRLSPRPGPLQNISLLFGPDGRAHPHIVRKVHQTRAEAPFTAAGAPAQLPIFETPAGRLAGLICADSWYPDVYAALRPLQPELIAVPNNEMPFSAWTQPWQGYDPGPPPPDVDPADIGRLSNQQAWLKYALPGRLQLAGAQLGIHVFSRWRMWDLSAGGQTIIATPDALHLAPLLPGAGLTNFWIPPTP